MGSALVLALAAAPSAAAKTVSFRGSAVTVPAAWPVYHIGPRSPVCVRFDRPAVYVGRPSPGQRCSARRAGRPQAILLEPHGSGAVVVRQAADTVTPGAAVARARARSAGATYTGLGFDACSTPSATTMSRWGASPYRAIGVYIGGRNMACSQPNLTAPWVSGETAAGWHLILIYVGLQAPANSCGCAGIDPGQATAQGRAAATDAVSRAGALGIGPGNAIYLDMEAYPLTSANSSAVTAFEAAWTKRLHADGYTSGIYSSAGSGVVDLVHRYGTSYPEPDDIWFAEWNGSASTSTSYIPDGYWPNHHRLHQYAGDHNETFGGARLNIDSDAVDGNTATAGRTRIVPDGTFIQLTSTGQVFRIAGGAPLFVSDPTTVGSPEPQSFTQVSPSQFAALPSAPVDGTFLTTSAGQLYRVAGGAPFAVSQPSLFPAAQPIEVDPWDLGNLGTSLAHLNSVPEDATVVQGLPSRQYWMFAGGRRRRTTVSPAIQVDDAGLAAFRMQPCLVPKLHHLTLGAARAALGQTNCRLGRVVRRRRPSPGHPLRVLRQFPGPNARRSPLSAVALRLG